MEVISSRASFIICVVLVCFAQSFAQSDKPVNTLAELRKRANLTCCSDRGSVIWKHQRLNNAGVPDQICSEQSCRRTGYWVDNSTPGCFHLIIESTNTDAAGLYQCNEVETNSVRGAYLVVYNFSCGVDFGNSDDLVEGDRVKFHWSVSWKGKWPFKIRLLNEVGKEIMQQDVINDVDPYYSSSFEVNVSRPNFPSHTLQFAFLNKEITDPNVDRSCPTVNWTSPARNVKYGPGVIKLSCPTEKCERRIDDTINCSADGNPIPEFHWLDWNDKKIAFGSVIELKCLGSHKYKCVATNIIRGKRYQISEGTTVNVNSKPDVEGSRCAEAISKNNVLIITLIVIIVVGVIIGLSLFAFCQIRKKLRVKKPKPSKPEHIELTSPAKEEAPEDDKKNLPPGEQNDLNAQINREEYKDDLSSANDAMELGLGPHVALRLNEVHQPSSIEAHLPRPTEVRQQTSTEVHQPVDSETSDHYNPGALVHPEDEVEPLLRVHTLAESEKKMRKSYSALPCSEEVEVVLHKHDRQTAGAEYLTKL